MGAKVIHVEVTGQDGPALQRFYADVFGWEFNTNLMDGYAMARQADGLTAGIGRTADGSAGMATFYVHADDPAATLRRAVELGGRVIMPLTEVAKDTTVALFADPEGHIVGLM